MKILDPKEKAKIIEESYEKVCMVTKLAKKYGVSESTIHRWRGGEKREEENNSKKIPQNFIEVPIQSSALKANLKKVELVYEEFRIEMDGKSIVKK